MVIFSMYFSFATDVAAFLGAFFSVCTSSFLNLKLLNSVINVSLSVEDNFHVKTKAMLLKGSYVNVLY